MEISSSLLLVGSWGFCRWLASSVVMYLMTGVEEVRCWSVALLASSSTLAFAPVSSQGASDARVDLALVDENTSSDNIYTNAFLHSLILHRLL